MSLRSRCKRRGGCVCAIKEHVPLILTDLAFSMCACAFVIYDEVEMETFDSTISVSFFISHSNTCYHSHTVWVTHSLSHPLMLFLSCTVHARNRIRLVKNRNSFDSNHNKRLQRHGSKRSNECDCSGNSLKLKQSTAFIHCQCRLFLLF